VTRDLAVVVDEPVAAGIFFIASGRPRGWIKEIRLFDLYRGTGSPREEELGFSPGLSEGRPDSNRWEVNEFHQNCELLAQEYRALSGDWCNMTSSSHGKRRGKIMTKRSSWNDL